MTRTSIKRAEQKRKLLEMLGGKCLECGYNKNAASLDFHHVNSKEKDAVIGYLINFHKFERAYEEAKKCKILCKNCHTELHNPNLEISCIEGVVEYKFQQLREANKECGRCGNYAGGQIYCSPNCANVSNRKIKDRPSREELQSMIESMSFCAIGKKYGLSDNGVRKWARTYGLII